MKSKIDFSKIPYEKKARKLEQEYADRAFAQDEERKLELKNQLNYRYFRFWRKNTEVSISVGYKIIGGLLEYSVALQSKNDYFSRKEARKIVNERWKNGYRAKFSVPFFTREVDVLIVCHWNGKTSGTFIYGIDMIPEYLRRIPVSICL